MHISTSNLEVCTFFFLIYLYNKQEKMVQAVQSNATKLVPHLRSKEALNRADIPSSEWEVEAGTGWHISRAVQRAAHSWKGWNGAIYINNKLVKTKQRKPRDWVRKGKFYKKNDLTSVQEPSINVRRGPTFLTFQNMHPSAHT